MDNSLPMHAPRAEPESVQAQKPASGGQRPFTDPISGHQFRDGSLYHRALTHTSAAVEAARRREPTAALDGTEATSRPDGNQQLEFLGDAVLGLAAARELYFAFPDADEGTLSRMRASLVSRDNLAAIATRLRLAKFLRVGRGEERSGGRQKPALLADALEALIAAIYLDAGFAPAAIFVAREVVRPSMPALEDAAHKQNAFGDYKTALQVRLQSTNQLAEYAVVDTSGPPHERLFRVQVKSKARDGLEEVLAEAEGASKKRAEQEAARLALLKVGAQAPMPTGVTAE